VKGVAVLFLVNIDEAVVRLEELIDLTLRQDEIYLCRDGRPVAVLGALTKSGDVALDDVWALAARQARP
jgi:antitoxin (DNA-binding transcriptional repressor) of toxin-antitoxin stability system